MMDFMSDISTDALSRTLAARLAALRAAAKLSLQELADKSGVSRSMISSIERVETNPTAVVLDKLATALGTTISQLFDEPHAANTHSLLRRHADHPFWQDPASGYERRSLSPGLGQSSLRLVEVSFPPGATVAYDAPALAAPVHQEVWLISGRLQVTVGDTTHELRAGDCAAMRVAHPITFHNPSERPARYLVAHALA
jgi:transcriptional regulator with XRE-family HTH domain